MTNEDQEITSRRNLTDAQNSLSDLADDNFKAIIMAAVKSDNTLSTISLGNIDQLCLLAKVTDMLSEQALRELFSEKR